MSLVSVLLGTDHHAFNRLVDWADDWAGERPSVRVLVQHGHSPAPGVAEGLDFLQPQDLLRLVRASDVVVTHGGPGTMMAARSGGRVPILVPRDPANHEHVDDHQLRFSRWVEGKDLATVVRDMSQLSVVVDERIMNPMPTAAAVDPLHAPHRLAELLETVRSEQMRTYRRGRRPRRT